MSVLSDQVYALAQKLAADGKDPLVDIRVDVRGGAGGPDWHCIVWDGQVRDDPETGERLYDGLGVLATASGIDMGDVLTKVRDILTLRTENT